MTLTDWIQAVSAAIVAVLTIFIWRVASRQAELTKQSVDVARRSAQAAEDAARAAQHAVEAGAETAKRQLRAYVHQEGYHFEPLATPVGIEWHTQVRWRNSGQTPALASVGAGNWADVENVYALPAGFDFPNVADAQFNRANIGPGQVVVTHLVIPAERFWAAKSAGRTLIAYAWMEYTDALEPTVRRRTEVSNYILVDGDPRQPGCRFSLAITQTFNGIDSDCYRAPVTPP